jgi:pyruvate carboxylase subunit B
VKYFVTVGPRTYEVAVVGEAVTVDGEAVPAHLGAVPGTPLYHLLLGSASWTVAVEPVAGAADRWVYGAAGERREVGVVDERARQIQAFTGRRATTPHEGAVRAPMPGLVVRVEVAVGDRVGAGAGLLVVEAMKMENELRAPGAGVVTAVHVAAGAAVERGALLVTLELTGL